MKKLVQILGICIIITAITPPLAHAACNPTAAGNYTLNATDGSCSFAATNPGVDTLNGTNTAIITVPNTYTLTVAPGTTITSGSLVVNTGGQVAVSGTIKIGSSIYLQDTDSDGYPDSTTATISNTSPGATYGRRWAIANASTVDCYSSNANAKPGQTAYYTVNRGDGSFDYDCSGAITYQYQTCSCAACTSNTCPFSCVLNTTASGHTCGASENAGPSSCTKTSDIYGNCVSCTNTGTTSYTVGCH